MREESATEPRLYRPLIWHPTDPTVAVYFSLVHWPVFYACRAVPLHGRRADLLYKPADLQGRSGVQGKQPWRTGRLAARTVLAARGGEGGQRR